VTIETAGLGADAGAEGAVNLKFITKRGSNQYHGSGFEQLRHDALMANTYFNDVRGLAKARVRQHDFGGNLGGSLPLAKMKNKLFFFVNSRRWCSRMRQSPAVTTSPPSTTR
jgi:hypothetical protein